MNKQETYEHLRSRGIEFEICEHPAVYTMEEVTQIELPHPEAEAKNLFVRGHKKLHYYLISVKGDKRVDLKEIRDEFGLRSLSFAAPEELMEIMGLIPGSVSPLGLLNDAELKVTFFLDSEFGDEDLIGVHPNENTASIYLRTSDLLSVIREHGNQIRRLDL